MRNRFERITCHENPYRFFRILQELNGSHEAEIDHTLLRQKLDEIIRHNVQSLHFLQVSIHQNLLPVEVVFIGFAAAENAPYHDRCATRIGAEKRKKSGKNATISHIQPRSPSPFPLPPSPSRVMPLFRIFMAWTKDEKVHVQCEFDGGRRFAVLDEIGQGAGATDEGRRRSTAQRDGANDGWFSTAISAQDKVDFWSRTLNNVFIRPGKQPEV